MMALYERPDVRARNIRIIEKFRSGQLSRKGIAADEGVTYAVVCDAIKRARAEGGKRRHCHRCSCGRRVA